VATEPLSGAVQLPLHGKHAATWPYALLDAADYAWASQWAWRAQPDPQGRPVVQRSYRDAAGHVVRVVLARALLDLNGTTGGQVRFKSGDSLDLRRQNLLSTAGTLPAPEAPPEAADWPAPRGPEAVSALARRLGLRRQQDVLALDRGNDPFVAGTPTDNAKAQWFAGLWRRFGYTRGVHLRRVHYQLGSQPGPRDWQDAPYLNTENAWEVLQETARLARYLDLIPPHLLVDHRNPEARVLLERPLWTWPREATVELPDAWALPTITSQLADQLTLAWPTPEISGYEYTAFDQPYLTEVWCEKSTMNDVLVPLCARYHATLVTGLGYLSITAIVALLRRVVALDKPTRLLYISDFDPAGTGMPVQVARQIEFWLDQYAPGADIALVPVALTAARVARYRLPRSPIKESEKGKARFEATYGADACELDALEALHPGELARLVEEYLTAYHDGTLPARLRETEAEAQEVAENAWREASAELEAEQAAIGRDVRAILRRYEGRLAALDAELRADLAPMQERLTELWQATHARCISFDPALPDRPAPDARGLDEDAWLYRSDRPYVAQLGYYQRHKAGAGDAD
jgi:hypothetical protein